MESCRKFSTIAARSPQFLHRKSCIAFFAAGISHGKLKIVNGKIKRGKNELGFVVTFWVCAGMKTEIRDAAENFGEEFFRAAFDYGGATLICELFNSMLKSGILREDLEYKNCRLDLTLTGKL